MERDPDLDNLTTLTDLGDTSPVAGPDIASVVPETRSYQVREVIGRGGMGEVVLAHDPNIGRDVALKRMRGQPTAEAVTRFLREAKIQARLEHPGIVPVYELGRDGEGRPFFTMKRLTGTTMATVLDSGEATLQRLLRVLVDVCQAVELAHSRGVVHRDLKPSNIMLGDFGEVYVIDWGIARVLDGDELQIPDAVHMTSPSHTRAGQILGTPGYMSPEQIHGDQIGPPSDVYALGSILFELLAREPLHPRGPSAIGSTLSGLAQLSPAARQPQRRIPPELDAVCVAALAEDPAARPSARELAESIQRYLDGDRDLERRRALASELVAEGRAAAEAGRRSDAMRSCGRALAMDPTSMEAAALVRSLVLEMPAQLPAEVETSIAATEDMARRQRSRRAVGPYLLWFLITPLLPFMQVESLPQLVAIYVTVTLLALLSYLHWSTGTVPVAVNLILNMIALAVLSRLAGPFMLTPVMICGVLLSVTAQPWLNDRPLAVIGYTVAVILLPFALEAVGVFPRSWQIAPEGLVSRGTVFVPGGKIGMISAFVANLTLTVVVALFARAVSRDRRLAQRRLHSQTWHLHQLLPRRPARPEAAP